MMFLARAGKCGPAGRRARPGGRGEFGNDRRHQGGTGEQGADGVAALHGRFQCPGLVDVDEFVAAKQHAGVGLEGERLGLVRLAVARLRAEGVAATGEKGLAGFDLVPARLAAEGEPVGEGDAFPVPERRPGEGGRRARRRSGGRTWRSSGTATARGWRVRVRSGVLRLVSGRVEGGQQRVFAQPLLHEVDAAPVVVVGGVEGAVLAV